MDEVPILRECWHCHGKVDRNTGALRSTVDYWCLRCRRGWQWNQKTREWESRLTATLERFSEDGEERTELMIPVRHDEHDRYTIQVVNDEVRIHNLSAQERRKQQELENHRTKVRATREAGREKREKNRARRQRLKEKRRR